MTPRRRTGLAAAVVAAVVVVAVAVVLVRQGAGDGSGSGSAAGPQPVPTPAVPAPSHRSCASHPDVVVRNGPDLEDALSHARPGSSIRVADGTYDGEFTITSSGTAKKPIELCGNRRAVLSGGPVDGGYTLHLDGASYWRVVGLTIEGGQKGLMADRAVGNVIDGITVRKVGDEAIHLRDNSTDNVVERSTVRGTGLRKPQYGEGIYVGTAESNWCDVSDCDPDHSDRNVVRGNDVADTTAESVDLKEGTSDGVLADNTFSGAGMSEGDSWVDVKGNGWTISGNRGTEAPEDGFQVHQILDGWGQHNTFKDNRAQVSAGGYAINVTKQHDGNVVTCSNVAHAAGSGLTNIDCT